MVKCLMYVACLLGAWEAGAGTAYSHPLNSVLTNLKSAASEVEAVGNQADADIKEEAQQLKRRLGEVARDAFLAPVNIAARRIGRFGFELAPKKNDLAGRSELRETGAAKPLTEEAYSLNPANWIRLEKISALAVEDVRNIGSSIREVESLLSADQKNEVSSRLDLSVLDSYRHLHYRAKTTVACIGYFSQAYPAAGLVPVRQASGYVWSAAELKKKYGVERLTDLTASNRKVVAATLSEFLDNSIRFNDTCVSKAQYKFILNEMESIEQ